MHVNATGVHDKPQKSIFYCAQMSDKEKLITTAEIARLARVSRGTVDRVIHKRGRVSPESRKKVEDVLKDVDYRPNIYARGLVLSKTFRFGIFIPNISYGVRYWDLPKKGVEKAIKELKSYRVAAEFFFYDNYSAESFEKIGRQVLKNAARLDGLLVAPVYSRASRQFISHLPAHLPYVLLDTDVPNSAALSFIGQDGYQNGKLSAKLMHILIKTTGSIAVIRELPENYHINERIDGFLAYFKEKNFTIRIIDADRKKNPLIFYEIVKKMINSETTCKGIYIPSSFAHEAAHALKSFCMEKNIYIVGCDLTDENRACLSDGSIDFLTSQRPEMQGYRGVFELYKHVVLKEKTEKRIMMPLDIATRENIDSYR